MSTTVTSPACVLAGRDPQPRLAGVEGRGGGALGPRRPAISPVEASTPLGTSQATTTASGRAAALIASIAPRPRARAARRRSPVPRIASTIAAAPGQRHRVERTRRLARQPLEVGRGHRPRSSLALGEQQHVDVAAPLAQQPRGHQPVAAVVALAADDHDPALRGARRRRARPDPAPARSIRSSPGIPRSSIAHSSSGSLLRRRRAAARASRDEVTLASLGALGDDDRDRGRVPSVWVSDISHPHPELGRARRPPRRAARPTAARRRDTTSTSRKLHAVEPERLGDRLLGAEPRRQVLAGPRPRGRILALAGREQPLGEPRRRSSARSRRSISSRSIPTPELDAAPALTRP